MERRRRVTAALVPFAVPVLLAVGVAAGCGDDDDDTGSALPPQAAEGRQIATRAGCVACHGADGQGGTGPAWTGALGREVQLDDGTTVTVDQAYLTRSIEDPSAQVHEGFSVQMPQNQLTDDEVAAVVAYIVALDASSGTAG